MAREFRQVDITDNPADRELVDDLRHEEEPRILRVDDADVAIILPLSERSRHRERHHTAENYASFLSSAGGWGAPADARELDEFAEYLAERRRRSSRPPVEQ